MKIYLPIIRGKSGSDVFTWNLANGLKEAGISSVVKAYHPMTQLFPPLLNVPDDQNTCNIVHANSWNGFLFKQDLPLIVTEHTAIHDPAIYPYKSNGQKIYHQFVRRSEEKTLVVADSIVCVSSYCRKILEEQFGTPCDKVIYNGVDTDFFRKQNGSRTFDKTGKNEKITLFFAGNQTRMKGFDLLLTIASRLKGIANIIISSGFKQNRVEKISSNIMSVGTLSREEMVQYYSTSDIYLFPTRLEGCSLTVAEAMACEMPVVATNCASLPEQIDHEKGGLLCRMDDVHDFVDQILYLSEDAELRNQMGKYNREKVLSQYTISKMTTQYLELYQKLLS